MELLVELFEEDAFFEGPAGWLSDRVHVPSFGDDTVFDDARVADEGVDTVGGHHRDRVTIVDGRGRVFLGLITGNVKATDYTEEKDKYPILSANHLRNRCNLWLSIHLVIRGSIRSSSSRTSAR